MKQDLPKVAYLINQYPKVSHSFIRREIQGIEACGISVQRYAIRSCLAELVDPLDQQEALLTRTVLGQGAVPLLWGLIQVAFSRPVRLFQALGLAIKLGLRSQRGLLRHLIYCVEACLLLNWFAQDQIQHIHAHFGTNSTTVAMLCTALGGPTYSFTIHGPEEFDSIQALSIVEKVQRAAFVVTVSSFGKSQLYRWCDQSQWNKIKVVHCGVDREFFAQATPISTEPRLVCVGRLCEAKGQLLLIEAIKPLVNSGVPLKLVLVGDGPLRSQLEALIAGSNLQNHVEITGWANSETVRQQLLAARVMVLPSFAEGLPVAIMEALALYRPVISTYIAGIPELVVPGCSGWLVPSGSIANLTEVMNTALELPVEVLEQMGQAGAEQVARDHDAAIEACKLAALFTATLNQAIIEKAQAEAYNATISDPIV